MKQNLEDETKPTLHEQCRAYRKRAFDMLKIGVAGLLLNISANYLIKDPTFSNEIYQDATEAFETITTSRQNLINQIRLPYEKGEAGVDFNLASDILNRTIYPGLEKTALHVRDKIYEIEATTEYKYYKKRYDGVKSKESLLKHGGLLIFMIGWVGTIPYVLYETKLRKKIRKEKDQK